VPQPDLCTSSSPPPVVAVVQYAGQTDHFAGVDAALAARSVRVIRINEWELGDLANAGVDLIAVKDAESPLALAALRWAAGRPQRVPTLLLMDGVVEYRNTFINPDAPERFLRPAPVDAIACAGESDRARLWSWGNVAVATGLPRIAAAFPEPLPLPHRGCLLIATAKCPAFNTAERSRLLDALREVRDEVERSPWRNRVCWRLTAGLEEDLGVANDTRDLRGCLTDCSAVLTTPSTLLIEAMVAGRPCAVLHPQDGPLWQDAIAVWRGRDCAPGGDLASLLARLDSPQESDWLRQRRALERMHAPADGGPDSAATRLAGAIVSLLREPSGSGPARKRDLPSIQRTVLGPTAFAPRQPAIRRVVSCVSCDSTPIGGVMTWSLRMGREFAARAAELGYEFRTLVVAMQPEGWKSHEFDPTIESAVDLCVLDPLAPHHQRVETIRSALAALSPDIVLPNYNDACFMAAALLRPSGVRTVAIAHADDDYYTRLAATYDTWSAAVGVSAACMRWLSAAAAGRPVEQIVYGVPVAPHPAERPAGQPLRLAYIGRMVEEQKRIGDLLTLLDELEARAVPCELHMVGDGPDLATWRARCAQRRHAHTRVVIHGRRSPSWVEQFLPTIDACILVSSYEGTSVVMLEAMARGVLPVVTDVRSGVHEWLRDGDNGVVVPVGDMRQMAARLAAINADRPALATMAERAWRTIRDSGLSIASTATAYARVFDAAMSRPRDPRPTDSGLRPTDLWRWTGGGVPAPEHADEADAWCRRVLVEAGYRAIALDAPAPSCDAVLVRSSRTEPVAESEIAAWRSAGLGVAVSPHLRQDGLAARALALVRSAVASGRSRIALYPAGRHTRRIAEIFRDELWPAGSPFVGLLDDAARPGQRALGLPVVRPSEAVAALAPDAVLLSSDTFEESLWQRTAHLRQRGIDVLTLYGTYPHAQVNVVAPSALHAEAQGTAHAHRAR